ncbi:hypothetical protein Tco_0422426 [Tanacetum coccineum]
MQLTRYKGKEIAKTNTPSHLNSASEEDSDLKKLRRTKDHTIRLDQLGAEAINVVGLGKLVGGPVVQHLELQFFNNCKEFGHYAKECRKPKRLGLHVHKKQNVAVIKKHITVTRTKIQEVSKQTSDTMAKPLEQGKRVIRLSFPDSPDNEITELQCLYLHKVMECDCLAQKLSEQTDFVSKEIYTELLQRFARLEKHSISLEIALQECQVQLKNDTVCKEKASDYDNPDPAPELQNVYPSTATIRLSGSLSAYAGTQVFFQFTDGRKDGNFLMGPLKEEVYVAIPDGIVDPRSSRPKFTDKGKHYMD